MSPSNNPQKRFTQPLLINLSRAMGQLFVVANWLSKTFFSSYRLQGVSPVPALSFASVASRVNISFLSRFFLAAAGTWDDLEYDNLEDFDKLLLILHLSMSARIRKIHIAQLSPFAVGPDSGHRESGPAPWALPC